MKILAFSDLHLDTPFAWAPRDAARRRRQNLRTTLRNILALASHERVDAILSGGDLFEHERLQPDTVEFLRRTFGDIAPVRVFLAPGNHDWCGPSSPYATADWPSNVHVFTDTTFEPVELETGLTLWGAAHKAPANTPNLLEPVRVDRGGIHIALFHGSERGFLPFLEEEGKQPYAPFREADIERAGFHHAFLGHFHTPKQTGLLTYPGNPDPLTFGEHGERGALIAGIGPNGTIDRRVAPVAVSEVHDVVVQLTDCSSHQDVLDAVNASLEGMEGFLRLTLIGEVASDVALEPRSLDAALDRFEAVEVRMEGVKVAYGLEAISQERGTVRAFFVNAARGEISLSEEERRRVLVTGLRALDGRTDLEVP
jgi:DNA repair protein SbcD/Mre11